MNGLGVAEIAKPCFGILPICMPCSSPTGLTQGQCCSKGCFRPETPYSAKKGMKKPGSISLNFAFGDYSD